MLATRLIAVAVVALAATYFVSVFQARSQLTEAGREHLRVRLNHFFNPFPRFGRREHYTELGWALVRRARVCFWAAVVGGVAIALAVPRM